MQTNNGKQSHIHPCPAILSLYLEQWTPPSLSLLPFSSSYAGEAHFRKGDGRKGFSLLSTKMHDEQLPRVHSNEKEHHVYFYRDGGESKCGVRSVHYTKVESAIESLLSRKAALYSGSRGENKRYTGVIPLSLGAFSIPASIRNSL